MMSFPVHCVCYPEHAQYLSVVLFDYLMRVRVSFYLLLHGVSGGMAQLQLKPPGNYNPILGSNERNGLSN